jgi:hypothetical protein
MTQPLGQLFEGLDEYGVPTGPIMVPASPDEFVYAPMIEMPGGSVFLIYVPPPAARGDPMEQFVLRATDGYDDSPVRGDLLISWFSLEFWLFSSLKRIFLRGELLISWFSLGFRLLSSIKPIFSPQQLLVSWFSLEFRPFWSIKPTFSPQGGRGGRVHIPPGLSYRGFHWIFGRFGL